MKKVSLVIILLALTGLSAGSYRTQKAGEVKSSISKSMDEQTAQVDKMLIVLKAKR